MVMKMMSVAASPTISQIVYSMNNPQTVNVNVGTANVEASAGASTISTDSSSMGAADCGSCSGVDTFA